jgi:hypothetical protein
MRNSVTLINMMDGATARLEWGVSFRGKDCPDNLSGVVRTLASKGGMVPTDVWFRLL